MRKSSCSMHFFPQWTYVYRAFVRKEREMVRQQRASQLTRLSTNYNIHIITNKNRNEHQQEVVDQLQNIATQEKIRNKKQRN